MSSILEQARQAVLNESEKLEIQGIVFTVPPVPNAVMKKFCETIRLWEEITTSLSPKIEVVNGEEKTVETSMSQVEFLELVLPIVESLVEVFYLTVTTLDASIDREAIEILVTPNNFVQVYQCLARTSGLAPKLVSEVKENQKKAPRNGRTGTKS